MDLTELAHWRYRVKALERDVQKRSDDILGWSNFPMLPAEHWESIVLPLRSQRELERYLLEEARYMCELGELGRTGGG